MRTFLTLLVLAGVGGGCSSEGEPEPTEAPVPTVVDDPAKCVSGAMAAADSTPFLETIGCQRDFDLLSSEPLSASIPGARSVKTVIDRLDSDHLYFQNSKTYKVHWEFASEHLSGKGLPPVPTLADFNQSEYYSPSRRFVLGAVTYYEEPGVWAYEISPYDTASADMIQAAYEAIAKAAWFGPALYFHPTSEAVAAVAKGLPDSVRQISTGELFAGISYQPLNPVVGTGKLRFLTSDQLDGVDYGFRDIVVLERVPNDIGVVAGIVTQELQTPLSHINVLSQNRGTPNMALLSAWTDERLRSLEDKWVRLEVRALGWEIAEITQAEAEQWWEDNKPKPVGVPPLDLDTQAIVDLEDLHDGLDAFNADTPPTKEALAAALAKAIPAYGGKASHYAMFTHMGDDFPAPRAFAIPIYYYWQHMESHGLNAQVAAMLADPEFQGDRVVRDTKLSELRDAIKTAPLDAELLAAVETKMATEFPGLRMRFRSSTNAEDLDGFTGAGLYTSKSGALDDPERPVANAIRSVWASIWRFKAYDEREYRSIDHAAVGMALLCHHSFPNEEANGVAFTANIFDTSGLEPGFYINVQAGESSVVLPEPGTTTDQLIYQYYAPGQPVVFLSHSNLIEDGERVLTNAQLFELGWALDTIHRFFRPLYGPPVDDPLRFYAMDIEFKLDDDWSDGPKIWVKQARPAPSWGF